MNKNEKNFLNQDLKKINFERYIANLYRNGKDAGIYKNITEFSHRLKMEPSLIEKIISENEQ